MIETLVHKEEYKGKRIEVHQDSSPISPEDDRNKNVFLVGYHRNFWTEGSFDMPKGLAQEIYAVRFGAEEEKAVDPTVQEYIDKYYIFGLEAYIHGDVCLSIASEGNFPDRQWDVSCLGLIFVAKSEAADRDKAKEIALGLIRYWNSYLSGNVYGYMVFEDKKCPACSQTEYKVIDSCWSFYGDYEFALEEARAQVDHYNNTTQGAKE